jgi:hypothetical protein
MDIEATILDLRQCRVCKESKPVYEFPLSLTRSKNYDKTTCRNCKRERTRKERLKRNGFPEPNNSWKHNSNLLFSANKEGK